VDRNVRDQSRFECRRATFRLLRMTRIIQCRRYVASDSGRRNSGRSIYGPMLTTLALISSPKVMMMIRLSRVSPKSQRRNKSWRMMPRNHRATTVATGTLHDCTQLWKNGWADSLQTVNQYLQQSISPLMNDPAVRLTIRATSPSIGDRQHEQPTFDCGFDMSF
jgi:hypothetical protein